MCELLRWYLKADVLKNDWHLRNSLFAHGSWHVALITSLMVPVKFCAKLFGGNRGNWANHMSRCRGMKRRTGTLGRGR